jgi:hypothetical protein
MRPPAPPAERGFTATDLRRRALALAEARAARLQRRRQAGLRVAEGRCAVAAAAHITGLQPSRPLPSGQLLHGALCSGDALVSVRATVYSALRLCGAGATPRAEKGAMVRQLQLLPAEAVLLMEDETLLRLFPVLFFR